MFSQIKDRKEIEKEFSFCRLSHAQGVGLWGAGVQGAGVQKA